MVNPLRNKARGKEAERRLAKKLGGKRLPDTGGHSPDVETAYAYYELKSTIGPPPKWLKDAMTQLRLSVNGRSKPGILVKEFRNFGRGPAQRFYIFDEKTFLEEHGEGPFEGTDND